MVLESIIINWIWIYDMDAYSSFFFTWQMFDSHLWIWLQSTIFDESVISQGVDNKSCVQKRMSLGFGIFRVVIWWSFKVKISNPFFLEIFWKLCVNNYQTNTQKESWESITQKVIWLSQIYYFLLIYAQFMCLFRNRFS